VERTYSFGIEKLLYEWYAVCGRLATPCGGASEDIAVFEGEGDRLLLDSGWTRETEVCEGTEDKGGKEIRKRCECLQLGLLRLRFSHLAHDLNTIFCVNSKKIVKLAHVTWLTWERTSVLALAPTRTRKCITARTARRRQSTEKTRRNDAERSFYVRMEMHFWGNNLRAIAAALLLQVIPTVYRHETGLPSQSIYTIRGGLVMHGCLASQCVDQQEQGNILIGIIGGARSVHAVCFKSTNS
jgi:hypothetical protein